MDPITDVSDLRRELQTMADPEKAEFHQRFFKTGPGQYGEGDRFLGIRVPHLRALVPPARGLPLPDVLDLLKSPWHEERLLALLLLVDRYRRGDPRQRQTIHDAYLVNTKFINNWDLVDSSAQYIVGAHLDRDDLSLLRRLSKSDDLWERRIAMIATLHWIRLDHFAPTLEVAELLVGDDHDLIHKAVGWMLREVGKRNPAVEEEFLARHYREMPRTMLRYAIERFPTDRRKAYLRGEI